jgi:hypothetical protein
VKRFPKFLKSIPSFYGLSFYEIGALVAGLYIAMILELNPVFALTLCLFSIGAMKFLRQNFDFKGFIAPKYKEINLDELDGDKK